MRDARQAHRPGTARDPRRSAEGVSVLDSRLRPVRAGEVGEVYLDEPGLADGYLGRPGLTAAWFVADPAADGGRMYRTGDLALADEHGMLMFRGRVDDQIKIRGHRIEPGEIEAALRGAPNVGIGVVVAAAAPGAGNLELRAYVVAEPGRTVVVAEVDSWLREHLPGYMVPRWVTVLDRLPTTINGKLNRSALPAPSDGRSQLSAPESESERRLLRAMADVLEDDELGVTDDFFTVGGDSVRVVQLLARLRATGWEVDQRDVFDARTARNLAARITSAGRPAPSRPGRHPELESGIRDDIERRFGAGCTILPVSPMQFGMVFHSMLAPGQGMYQVQLVWDLDGPLDARRLRTAWTMLLDRHPNLLAAFVNAGSHGDIVAVVAPVTRPKWTWIDMDGSDPTECRLTEVLRAKWNSGTDPADAPLARLAVVSSGPTRHRLVLTAHHALFDGWSEPLLLRDLLHLYASGAPPVRPASGERYADYLRWLGRQDTGAALRAWVAQLSGVRPHLVAGDPRGSAETGLLTDIDLTCTQETVTALQRQAAEAGVTVNTVIQVCWGLALRRLTGSDDVMFGTTISGRDAAVPGIDQIVGLCINTVAVRIRAVPGEAVVELARRTQAQQLDLAPYSHIGLSSLHEELGVPALFDTVVVFQSYPQRRKEITAAAAAAGCTVAGFRSSSTGSYPLVLRVDVEPTVTMSVQYDGMRVPQPAAAAVARFMEEMLSAVATEPDIEVDAVDLHGALPACPGAVVAPEPPEPDLDVEVTERRSATERALADIFAEVLGRGAVLTDESFFALGGNSLKATRLVGRVRSALGLELSVRDVFEKSTVRGLAACLPVPGGDTTSAAVPTRPVLRKRVEG